MTARRRRAPAVALLAVVVLFAVGCAEEGTRTPTAGWSAPTTPGMHRLPRSGLPPRQRGVVAWSGSRLVVWGGRVPAEDHEPTTALVDGAVFDPAPGRWTAMAAPPFDMPLVDPDGARLGNDILIAGSLCDANIPPPTEGSPHCPSGPAAALYDPVANRWRRVANPPAPPAVEELDGDSRAGFVVDWIGRSGPAAMVYDRAGDTWTSLDPPEPVPSEGTNDRVSICSRADGSTAEVIYLDQEGPPYQSPLVNPRRWTLDLASATWKGPQPISGLDVGKALLMQLACPRDQGTFVVSTTLPPGETRTRVIDIDPRGAATPVERFDSPGLGLELWGDVVVIAPPERADRVVPPADGAATTVWALAHSGAWVEVASTAGPRVGLYGRYASVWAGDRLYYDDAVWLPPTELIRP